MTGEAERKPFARVRADKNDVKPYVVLVTTRLLTIAALAASCASAPQPAPDASAADCCAADDVRACLADLIPLGTCVEAVCRGQVIEACRFRSPDAGSE